MKYTHKLGKWEITYQSNDQPFRSSKEDAHVQTKYQPIDITQGWCGFFFFFPSLFAKSSRVMLSEGRDWKFPMVEEQNPNEHT